MKKKLILITIVFLPFILSNAQNSGAIYVANWNVQNLFDTIDDPDKRDEEFTPQSEIKWTEARLIIKLDNLAKVINDMNDGKGPDIIAFEEVEHQSLLERLSKRLNRKSYSFAYAEAPDKRGIDVGMMYDSLILKLNRLQPITVNLPSGYPTRYILYAEFQLNDSETLHIIANHWSSRRGGLQKSEPNRIAAAKTAMKKMDEILNKDSLSQIIILGDFNDEPNNESISGVLSAVKFECGDTGNIFYNLAYKLDEKNLGSYMYRGNFNMLDQIIISRGLVDGQGLDYKCGSFEIFSPEYVIQKKGKYKGAILPTYGGRKYLGGYSDHYPVGAEFIIR